jgi:hypothetical protein
LRFIATGIAVAFALAAQLPIMLAVCGTALVRRRGHLSAVPFWWAHLTGGLAGLSSTFPFIAFGLVALAAASAGLAVHRHPPPGASGRASPFQSTRILKFLQLSSEMSSQRPCLTIDQLRRYS